MISYQPLWDTMKKQNITTYKLITYYKFSTNTIRRMKHGLCINTKTLNSLCLVLNCRVQDVICFEPSKEELETITEQRLVEMKVKTKGKAKNK